MNDPFPVITNWQKSFDDYRASLWPDEIIAERILIRDGDLMHTPVMFHVDGILWRPVKLEMIGQRVGTRRIRRIGMGK